MRAHVLLNLFNELVKGGKMRNLPSILTLFRKEFDKFNNTGAQKLDSSYHITLKSDFGGKKSLCPRRYMLLLTSFHTCNVTQKSVNH